MLLVPKKVRSRGYKTVERGKGPKSLKEWSKGCQELGRMHDVLCVELVCQKSVPLVGGPALPFIDQGGEGVIDGRKRKIPKV